MNGSCWRLDKYARSTSDSEHGGENGDSWQVISYLCHSLMDMWSTVQLRRLYKFIGGTWR